MKKIQLALLILGMLLSLSVTSCRKSEGTSEKKEEPALSTQTIKDFTGREVTIPAADKIERIAVLTSPPNIITFVLGINDMLCATSNPIQRSVFLKRIYPCIHLVEKRGE